MISAMPHFGKGFMIMDLCRRVDRRPNSGHARRRFARRWPLLAGGPLEPIVAAIFAVLSARRQEEVRSRGRQGVSCGLGEGRVSGGRASRRAAIGAGSDADSPLPKEPDGPGRVRRSDVSGEPTAPASRLGPSRSMSGAEPGPPPRTAQASRAAAPLAAASAPTAQVRGLARRHQRPIGRFPIAGDIAVVADAKCYDEREARAGGNEVVKIDHQPVTVEECVDRTVRGY